MKVQNHFYTSGCLMWTFYLKASMLKLTFYFLITGCFVSEYTDLNKLKPCFAIQRILQNSKMSSTILKPCCYLYFEHDGRKNVDTFYTYLNKKSDILPNILGKHICLFYCFYLKALQHDCCMMHFGRAFCLSVSHEPLCQLMNVFVCCFFWFVSSECVIVDVWICQRDSFALWLNL